MHKWLGGRVPTGQKWGGDVQSSRRCGEAHAQLWFRLMTWSESAIDAHLSWMMDARLTSENRYNYITEQMQRSPATHSDSLWSTVLYVFIVSSTSSYASPFNASLIYHLLLLYFLYDVVSVLFDFDISVSAHY